MPRHNWTPKVASKDLRVTSIRVNGLDSCCTLTITHRKKRKPEPRELETLPCSKNSCRNVMWYRKKYWEWFQYKTRRTD